MVSNKIDVERTWGTAWLIYVSNLKVILLIILIFFFPFFILDLVFPFEQIYNRLGSTIYSIIKEIIELSGMFVGFLGFISFAIITEYSVLEIRFTAREVFCKACSKWWAYTKSILLSAIIITANLFLLIIPGIVRLVQYAFVTYAVSLRDVSGKEALKYSKTITEGQRWRVFGFYFLFLFIYIGSVIVYNSLIDLSDFDSVVAIVYLVINYFISSFFSILLGVLFFDLEKQWKNREMISTECNVDASEHSLSSP